MVEEDSPITGIVTPKSEASVSEGSIHKAIWERSDYFIQNSENVTLAGVRRLLEEDLGLQKNALDPFKKYIRQEIDQVFNSPRESKPDKDVEKNPDSTPSKNLSKAGEKEGSKFSGNGSDNTDDKVSEKESVPRKNKKLGEQKKRGRTKGADDTSRKRNKLTKREKDESSELQDDGNVSEDGQSQSSAEKPAARKEKSALGYGKKVEHLKSVIKACGMSVAPTIYKKAKQLHDDKREAFIVKELEAVLLREGLSKNPSEKDIKDCRKRKEKAKELEGIDMSNIISSTRKRSTFSFAAPTKSGLAKGGKIEEKDTSEKDDENDKDHHEDNDEEEEEKKTNKKKQDEEEEEKKANKKKEDEEEEGVEEVEEDDDDGDDEEEEEESEEFSEDDNDDSD